MQSSTLLAASIETALRQYLRQDPAALQQSAALEGKIIAMHVSGLDIHLFYLPGADGIQVLGSYEGTADTTLTGGPLGYVRLFAESREDAMFEGAVEIRGDTETGQKFQDILAAVNIDWEEQLSRATGDTVAHQTGRLISRARALFADSRATLAENITEYLQEEARLLPTHIEVQHFLDDVDLLRSDTDRLDARLQRLIQAADAQT